MKISTIISAFKDKEENFAADYFKHNIIQMITESNNEMNSLYDCFSEEISKMIELVKKFEKEENVNGSSLKLASDGWSGNICVFGEERNISKIGDMIIKHYDSYENRGQEIANLWISDDINKYCYWSGIGGSLAMLNPAFEDFMLI